MFTSLVDVSFANKIVLMVYKQEMRTTDKFLVFIYLLAITRCDIYLLQITGCNPFRDIPDDANQGRILSLSLSSPDLGYS